MGPALLPLLNIVGSVLDRVIPDKAAAEKAKIELLTKASDQEFTLAIKQIETNIEEAKSPSVWNSGWRPGIGWSCAVGVFYHFIGYPLLLWAGAIWFPSIQPPSLDTDGLLAMTGTLLGVAGLRSWEKYKGIARS